MGSPGWTQRPCHGCGSTELHRKDKLCPNCQRIYDDGILARKKQDSQEEKVIVRHSPRSHMISSPYLFERSGGFFNLNDRLRHAWSHLTLSVLEQAIGHKRFD